jgi:hypothetical protein
LINENFDIATRALMNPWNDFAHFSKSFWE